MTSADAPRALPVPARAPLSRHALRVRHKLARDAGVTGLPGSPVPAGPVSNRQLSGLPDAAQRYLRFMGVPGRPADWSLLAHCTGRFRLRPSWPWLPCEAWQYNSSLEVARVFRLRIGGPVPMSARDAYLRGEGSVHGTMLGLVHLVSGTGPEYDVSELVTYLNDAIFCAPGMLLALPVTWTAAGDDCFDVTLRDAGTGCPPGSSSTGAAHRSISAPRTAGVTCPAGWRGCAGPPPCRAAARRAAAGCRLTARPSGICRAGISATPSSASGRETSATTSPPATWGGNCPAAIPGRRPGSQPGP